MNNKFKDRKYWDNYFCNAGLTGMQKMKPVLSLMKNIVSENSILGDYGGTTVSFKLFKNFFPKTKIVSINRINGQIKDCDFPVCEDFSEKTGFTSNYFDIVFLGDVIEHLVEPDKLIIELNRVIKPNGYLILTTPNLANLINRLCLLLGYAPTNYHPSEYRYGTMFGVKHTSWHKSVFTVPAMKDFLKSYGFDVLKEKGFSYHNKSFLPTNLSEGMIILAKKIG